MRRKRLFLTLLLSGIVIFLLGVLAYAAFFMPVGQ